MPSTENHHLQYSSGLWRFCVDPIDPPKTDRRWMPDCYGWQSPGALPSASGWLASE
jgi:hypothetical protein